MSSPAERLGSNLQELIELQQITQVRIYLSSAAKWHAESSVWSFSVGFIQVDDHSYNLNQMHSYRLMDSTLSLFFS